MIIPDGVCDVWTAPFDVFRPHQRSLDALLTDAERLQADRCRRQDDRTRACLSRSLLRLVLSRYLRVEPKLVQLDRRCPVCGEPHGKPRLKGTEAVAFSVAHSTDLLVFAFVGRGAVGVDVEPLVDDPETLPAELIEMALTPAERRLVRDAPPARRWSLFLWYWTCKESVLKKLGTGLAVPLQEVSVPPPESAGPVALNVHGWRGSDVWVRGLDVGDAHVSAIATHRDVTKLRVARLPLAMVPGAIRA